MHNLCVCMQLSASAYSGLSSLIADFGGIGSSSISFTLGLDEMMHICRCALSDDELVFKLDFKCRDEMLQR